jgi:hypothetical protein
MAGIDRPDLVDEVLQRRAEHEDVVSGSTLH